MTRGYSYAFVCIALVAGSLTASAETRILRAGDNLQAAIDSAVPGDVIRLQPGATFTGNFLLPVKPGAGYITIRSDTPDAELPSADERIAPSYASRLARILSDSSLPAIRTAAGAHHWRLQLLEIGPNTKVNGDLIVIGDGGRAQSDLSQVPYAIQIDRVYAHGDRLLGQKRGIALNGRDVTIRGCYISDIKGVGQDTQAIAGWNGPGPYLIENNYLEAAGENVMFGGAQPYIPGVIADGVVLRSNALSRPVAWKDPILSTPGGVSARAASTGGVLRSGTYAYSIVAHGFVGQSKAVRSTASREVIASVPAGVVSGSVSVSWAPVEGATTYAVYGRTPGASTLYWTVNGTSFTDQGGAGAAGAVPTSAGTRWTVKNVFELKAARNVLAEYNTFENNWQGGQSGYAIVFTPRGQAGGCNWCVVENVTFQYNVVRHTSAAINILGYDNTSPTLQTRNIVIRHNLFYDINKSTWGGNGYFMLLGDEPRDITVDHNTIVHTGSALVYAYGGSSVAPRPVYGFTFTNNVARHNSFGIASAYYTYGLQALAGFYPGALVTGNLLAAGPASRYPAGNYFHSDFDGQFVDTAGDDYRLADTSPLIGAGTDGLDVGAEFPTAVAGKPALLEDTFDDNSLDTSMWVNNAVFSGKTDPSTPSREWNHRYEVGPLRTSGSGYNGIRTEPRSLQGAATAVQVLQVPDQASSAYMMFTIGNGGRHHYRFWLSNGVLALERKVNGSKRTLLTAGFVPAEHQYWRIRHDAQLGLVVFEVARAGRTGPGEWTVLYAERWNTESLPLDNLMIELKAGTSWPQSVTPGIAAFDNFRVTAQ